MSMHRLSAVMVGGLLCSVFTTASMGAFTPLFEVSSVSGSVVAQAGEAGDAKTLVGGEGFAYGTEIRTGPDSSVVILLSASDRVIVGPNTVVLFGESADNAAAKLLRLHKGRLETLLSTDFQNENSLQISSYCVVANMLAGGGATFEASSEADLQVIAVMLKGGQLELIGNDFRLPMLKEQDGLTVACAVDGSFVRLRNINGKYTVELKDSTGTTRLAEMVKDTVIKILRKPSETDANIVLVTVLEVGPDGNVVQADTYSDETPPGTGPDLITVPAPETVGEEPGAGPGDTPPEVTFVTTTSTSTSTTTTTFEEGDLPPPPPPPPPPTTTKPDATPRGRR